MGAHTPGPWIIAGTQGRRDVVTFGDEIIAQNIRPPDALLIAAAPDLLAALSAVNWALCDWKPEALKAYGLDHAAEVVAAALERAGVTP